MPGEDPVMLARVLELRAQIAAVEAEIEGMKTANKVQLDGGLTPAYGKDYFDEAAASLRNLANGLHQIGYF